MKRFFKKIIVWILTLEARLVLWKYKPRIVGITGSVGKTSAKDAIYTALAPSFYVRRSEKSYNSELGVPLTVLGCESAWSNPFLWLKNIWKGLAIFLFPNHYPRWLVLEIGLDRPGDISRVTSWLPLDVVVFTRMAKVPVHVEFFESPEALIAEKKKLLGALTSDGVAVINYDDRQQRTWTGNKDAVTLSYGFDHGASVRATHMETLYADGKPIGINFKIEYAGSVVPVTLKGVLGKQHVYPILAAVAVAASQNINLVSIDQAFKKYAKAPGRMRILEGLHETTLIDDSYNSSPTALRAALDVFDGLNVDGRKICVVGDMMELGKYTTEAHKKVGKQAAAVCDVLVSVGPRARYVHEGAGEEDMPDEKRVHYADSQKAAKNIASHIQKKDIVLIKGSQAPRTERITKALLAEPTRAGELLVRQEKEWKNR